MMTSGEVDGPPGSARSSAVGAQSLQRPRRVTTHRSRTPQRLLGVSSKPIASQFIKRSDCSVFIHSRHVREDDNSHVCAGAVHHEYNRFIKIREKYLASLVLRPVDVLDLGKHKLLALSQGTACTVSHGWRLTVKLRGRPEEPNQAPRAHILFRTGGDTTDSHGPLQRLLDPDMAQQLPKRQGNHRYHKSKNDVKTGAS